jgi:signal transduction histidine kinase/DNA-binding response OmpR family regulator
VLCALALIFPAAAAIGALFEVPLPAGIHRSTTPMPLHTALALGLGAAAVARTPPRSTSQIHAAVVALLATAVVFLGALMFVGWTYAAAERPGALTALATTLFGVALFPFPAGRLVFTVGEACAIAAGTVALAAPTVPWHTAAPLALLVTALFCRRPGTGLMTLVTSHTHGGAITRRLLAAVLLVPWAAALTRPGSLFMLALGAVVVPATWRSLRRAEHSEQDAAAAMDALEREHAAAIERYQQVIKRDEFKTQFFVNVAHELRTPLTLILGSVEQHLNASQVLDPRLQRDLEVVERNARTVLRHVSDLLDLARLDVGQLQPRYAQTDAAAVVTAAADHFSALASEQSVEFTRDAPAPVPAQTDAAMVQRIVVNLLANAFAFAPRGGRVRVSVRAVEDRFLLEIADSGPGIPAHLRDRVFKRFHQLECDTHPCSGSGLGLAIVRDLTALLGGRVTAGDAPEGGALFSVELPCTAPAGAVLGPVAQLMAARDIDRRVKELWTAEAPRPAAPMHGDSGRVLVVEDDHEMNTYITECLTTEGFQVTSAFDGQEGFERAIEDQPDLVLTDMKLPGFDGDELARRLRTRPELTWMPIVVLTGHHEEDARVRLLDAGVQDCLTKPFAVAELCARLRSHIAQKRAHEDVDRLRRQLESLSRAGTEIADAVANLPDESVRTVLQTIALNARTLTGAEMAAAGIGGDESRPFDIFAHVGVPPEQVQSMGRMPRPIGMLGLVAEEGHTVRIRDIREHPRYRGVPAPHPPVTSFLAVPIRFRGNVVGNLYLANKQGGAEFTIDDQHMAEMLAARAGTAVETAKLYAAEGRAHAWLQAVVDQMPEGVILMDGGGRVTLQNRSLRAFMNATSPIIDRFGNSLSIDLRHPFGERLAPDDLPIVRALLDREVTVGREFIARGPGDQPLPVLVSAAPVLMENGSLAGAVMVFQDVSTLKELERLREEWASIVAHDLRQPISAIALRCSLLLRGRLAPEQRDGIEQISTSVRNLSRMVSDLMDASLLESDRLRVTLGRLDLGQLLQEVTRRVPQAAHRTRTRTPPAVRVFVRADAQRLEQVVSNLLSNAVKYAAPQSDIEVELMLDGGNAHVVVQNRGEGIPEDELPFVFHRYARARGAGASAVKGLGLGLYIAKGLVTAHHGRMWAESVPGGVTSFHFTLPLDGPPVPNASRHHDRSPAVSSAAQGNWS